eukprot:GILK01001149.1.p1 GENE.GILK01001149.1~~GILK01001149.1.p1  ORF type:complete len:587 (-),score=65.58 GILK01001149.1:142-1860(-)
MAVLFVAVVSLLLTPFAMGAFPNEALCSSQRMKSMSWTPEEPVSECYCYTKAECTFEGESTVKLPPVKIGDQWACLKSVPEECKDGEELVDNMCETAVPCEPLTFDFDSNPIIVHQLDKAVTCRRPIADLQQEGVLNCIEMQSTHAEMEVYDDPEDGPICRLKHDCVDISCAMAVSTKHDENFLKHFDNIPDTDFPVSDEFTAILEKARQALREAHAACTVPKRVTSRFTEDGKKITTTSYVVPNFKADIWNPEDTCCEPKQSDDSQSLPVLTCDDFGDEVDTLCGEETKFRPRLDLDRISFPDVYFPWQLENAPKTLMEQCCRPVSSAALCLPNWGNAYMSKNNYERLVQYTTLVNDAGNDYAADVAPTMFEAGDDDIFTCTMNCIAVFTKLTQCAYEYREAAGTSRLIYERQSKCGDFNAGYHTNIESKGDKVEMLDFKVSDSIEFLCDKLYPSAATSIEALSANVKVLLKVFNEKRIDIEEELPKLSTLVPTSFNERVFSIGCRDRCQGIMRRRTHASSKASKGDGRKFTLAQCTAQCGSYFQAIREERRRPAPLVSRKKKDLGGKPEV